MLIIKEVSDIKNLNYGDQYIVDVYGDELESVFDSKLAEKYQKILKLIENRFKGGDVSD